MRVPGLTIDDLHSTDLDDAVWAEPCDGGTRVFVTIAAASAEVLPGSPLDAGARERVVTRYFAGGHSSMLPRGVEEKLSLLPGVKRRGVTVELVLDADHEIVSSKLYASKIESKAKLSYGMVPGILASPGHVLHDPLHRLMAVAMGLLNKRRQRGAFVLYDLAHGWVATEEGHVKKLERAADAAGHIIVQELAIAANVAAASYAIEHAVPVLFRNHQAVGGGPDREPVLALLQQAVSGDPVAWLDEVRRKVGVMMHRAEYGAAPAGHFGLNLPHYVHFTSPIRRYADLITQAQIVAALLGVACPHSGAEIEVLAAHINSTLALHRDAEEARHKEKATAVAQEALVDTRRVDALAGVHFERMVKVVARAGEDCPPPFAEVFLRRLVDHRVSILARTVVLLEPAASGPGWVALRERIVVSLVARPWDAISILTMAKQVLPGWPEALCTVTQDGPSNAPSFSATWSVREKSAAEPGASSKEAKQRAAVALLAVLVDVPRPSFPQRPVTAAPPVAPAPGAPVSKDPIMQLGELAQKSKTGMPSYGFKHAGEPHAPEITATCWYQGKQTLGTAGAKQDAKRAAAAAMLVLLGVGPAT